MGMRTKIVNGERRELTAAENEALEADERARRERKERVREANGYRRKRASAYPSVADQLDMLYHAMAAGEIPVASEWFGAIERVKRDNPKPPNRKK